MLTAKNKKLLVYILAGAAALFLLVLILRIAAPFLVAPVSQITRAAQIEGVIVTSGGQTLSVRLADGTQRSIALTPATAITDVFDEPADTSVLAEGVRIRALGTMTDAVTLRPQTIDVLDTKQKDLVTGYDAGMTFTYPVASRFSIVLSASRYDATQLSCVPDGVIGAIENAPRTGSSVWSARFAAIAPGRCTLTSGDFSVRIVVPDTEAQPMPTGSVSGIVSMEAPCPQGQDACSSAKYGGRTVELLDEGGDAVATSSVADDGSYSITAAPGSYRFAIVPVKPGESANAPSQVTVRVGDITRVNISIDTGR